MTAASAEPPFQAARESGRAGRAPAAPEPETPTWTELADALYLAACQDAALPVFPAPPPAHPPGRAARA
ncbi:hypothetical protein, partial [Streptomyces sp. CC224B]|uniref:hypothetical protein n=1 Tax=Streptomyces sp. CC224B TaxID=3044571 RepID=UPI0024A82E20